MKTESLTRTSFQNEHIQVCYELTHLPESKLECSGIFKDIFIENEYGLNEQVYVKDNDVIVDLGGNHGFFSVYVSTLAKNLTFYIFEPIPITFQCLLENINRHVLPQGHHVHTFQKGNGGRNMQQNFSYYPGFSTLSGLFHSQTNHNFNQAFKTMPKEIYAQIKAALEAYNIKENPEDMWHQASERKETVSCDLIPLSDVINNEKIKQIDLLKIDTQGAEVDVLKGINSEDWTKIRQVALEINMWPGLDSFDFDFFTFFEDRGYDVTMLSSKLTPWNNRLLFATRKN